MAATTAEAADDTAVAFAALKPACTTLLAALRAADPSTSTPCPPRSSHHSGVLAALAHLRDTISTLPDAPSWRLPATAGAPAVRTVAAALLSCDAAPVTLVRLPMYALAAAMAQPSLLADACGSWRPWCPHLHREPPPHSPLRCGRGLPLVVVLRPL